MGLSPAAELIAVWRERGEVKHLSNPQEEKTTVIPGVVASETDEAKP